MAKPSEKLFIKTLRKANWQRRALQESEERYKLIVENSTDIIFTLDTTGRFIYISPSIKNVLGYQPNDLIGVPFNSLVHPDDVHVIDEAELIIPQTTFHPPQGKNIVFAMPPDNGAG